MCIAVFRPFKDSSLNQQYRLMLLVHLCTLCTLCAPSESSLNQLEMLSGLMNIDYLMGLVKTGLAGPVPPSLRIPMSGHCAGTKSYTCVTLWGIDVMTLVEHS